MAIRIVPVSTSKQLMQFIKLPFRLYKNDPNWVPPLIMDQKNFFNPKKNPYYEHSKVQLFLALKDGKAVGRISAQTNTQHNKEHNDKVGFFGFYESENDPQIAQNLFDAAEAWLREQGCDTSRGPMNFSVNDECGLLIDGFDTMPYIMMPHHHKWYQDIITGCGYEKAMDLYAWHLHDEAMNQRLEKFADRAMKRGGFTVREVDKKNLRRDIEMVFELYTRAWEYNWGFVPMTRAEFDHTVKTLLPVVDTSMAFIAEIDGTPVGFSVALPDYNLVLKKMNGRVFPIGFIKALYYKNKIRRARILTLGIVKEYQKRGIDAVFHYMTYKNGQAKGYYDGELSWILETNTVMNQAAAKLGATIHKTYRIFDKSL